MMKRDFLAVTLSIGCSLLTVESAHAQGYFYGYYYPAEGRFRTDQMTRPNIDVYGIREGPFTGGAFQATSRLAAAPTPAKIRVILPDPNAKVWFANYATNSTGTDRLYQSVPLANGSYQFQVRTTFMDAGREVIQERTVIVSPGQTSVVDFTSGRSAPATK